MSNIQIIKIPLQDNERVQDFPIEFPRFNRLYLELIENKDKIKQDLINVEHVPSEDLYINEPIVEDRNDYDERKLERQKRRKRLKEKGLKKSDDSSSSSSVPSSSDDTKIEISPKTDNDEINEDVENYEKSDGSDELSDRLKELLEETDDNSPSSSSVGSFSKSLDTKSVNQYQKYKESVNPKNAPTLAELKATGHYQSNPVLRNINNVSMSEQQEEDKKRELIFKFDILKKSYPDSNIIPEHTIHTDLNTIQKSYDLTVRKVSLDSTVENYKKYLIGGFMLTEFVLGKFVGFDMNGFTQQQIVSMHNYDRLLIELGEKSYIPSGSRWPVELRLLFLIIMNAGIFIVGKMILKSTGANLMNMINNMNTTPNKTKTMEVPVKKRRMKGPNIKLDELPDITVGK